MAPTPDKTVPVFTRLTAPDVKLLERIAKRERTTRSMFIRGLVEGELKRERGKAAKARAAAKARREQTWPPSTL